jgi:hypothetical protein
MKTLAARLLYLDCIPHVPGDIHHPGTTAEEVAQVLNYLHGQMIQFTNAGGVSPDTQQLDKFLQEAAQRLRSSMDLSPFSLGGSQAVRHGLDLLHDVAQRLSCYSCSHPSKVCYGHPYHDAEVVSRGGECIKPLKRLFEVARDVARLYYSKYATNCGRLPAVEFSTSYDSIGQTLTVPYHVRGETEHASGEGNPATVRLYLDPQHFDRSTYWVVPYVLFHECICHAFQPMKSQPGRTAEPYDGFSEGWMDWVAYSILNRLCLGQDPGGQLVSQMPHAADNAREAGIFHGARQHVSYPLDTSNPEAPTVLHGVTTAKRFFGVLDHLPGNSDNNWPMFFRISFDLNLQHEWNMETETFFRKLASNLADPRKHKQIKSCIISFLKSNDIRSLIGRILALPS